MGHAPCHPATGSGSVPKEGHTVFVRLSPTVPGSAQPMERVAARRLWGVAPLTVFAALLANILVQALAHAWSPVTLLLAIVLRSLVAP